MFARLQSLLRLLFVWRIGYVPDEAMDNPPDCIIMLAFGQQVIGNPPDDVILPGPANEAIAMVMESKARSITYPKGEQRPPILAQWELSETRAFKENLYLGGFKIEETFGKPGVYRNTREILEEIKQYMDKRGWKRATIVAHPHHLLRCTWTTKSLGIEAVNDSYMVHDLKYGADVWNGNVYVPDNQLQTTSRERWLWYEFRARGYFWLKGWI